MTQKEPPDRINLATADSPAGNSGGLLHDRQIGGSRIQSSDRRERFFKKSGARHVNRYNSCRRPTYVYPPPSHPPKRRPISRAQPAQPPAPSSTTTEDRIEKQDRAAEVFGPSSKTCGEIILQQEGGTMMKLCVGGAGWKKAREAMGGYHLCRRAASTTYKWVLAKIKLISAGNICKYLKYRYKQNNQAYLLFVNYI